MDESKSWLKVPQLRAVAVLRDGRLASRPKPQVFVKGLGFGIWGLGFRGY